MKKEKKPEKIILDLVYASNITEIKEQISVSGYQCEECRVIKNSNSKTDASKKGFWEHILYITDAARNAEEARNAGAAVLIYLHEENTGEQFEGFRFFIEGFQDADATYYTRVYLRKKRIPWTIGESKHLLVREMMQEDMDALYELYEDKQVVVFMDDLPEKCKEEKDYFINYIDKMYGVFGFGMWVVLLKESGKIIGRVGFQNSEEDDVVEIGFLISPGYQGKGYAYEACRIALEYMEKEYDYLQIKARCHKENHAAIGLCKRLGVECTILA